MPDSGLIAFLPLIAAPATSSTAPVTSSTAPATSSGLIVFLPLVAAFVGAIIGAYANSWYRDREAKKAEDRERKGLLSLISAEVDINNRLLDGKQLEDLEEDQSVKWSFNIASSLETSAWDQSQTRLAQLLYRGDLHHIVHYYTVLKVTRNQLQSEYDDMSPKTKDMMEARFRYIRSRGDHVRVMAQNRM
jgi:hypothetical protein